MNSLICGFAGLMIGFTVFIQVTIWYTARIDNLENEIKKLKRYNRELEDELNKRK